MPYIKSDDYERGGSAPAVPGELNYALTMRACMYFRGDFDLAAFEDLATDLCETYIQRVGMSYTNINAVIGVLICCSYELFRRCKGKVELDLIYDVQGTLVDDLAEALYHKMAAPYEDTKIEENGDVFPAEFVA